MARNSRLSILPTIILLFVLISGCNTSSGSTTEFASLPAGKGYSEGNEIYFSHTEASDQALSSKLTDMMKSPVIYVPSLSKAPEEMLSKVYVFENGISGKGPLGYQSDVFDNPPGSNGYSPLRKLHIVKWNSAASARILKSASEIIAASQAGEITITPTSSVVNMPFMVWEGGKR
jgi:hypothetical protein